MSSAQNRAFVTETVEEPVSLVVFGEESAIKECTIIKLQDVFPDFFVISHVRLGKSHPVLAYKVVLITSGLGEWRNAFALAKEMGSPFIVAIYGKGSGDLSREIRKKYAHTLVLIADREPKREEEAFFAEKITFEVFSERRFGIEKEITLPKLEYKGNIETSVEPQYSAPELPLTRNQTHDQVQQSFYIPRLQHLHQEVNIPRMRVLPAAVSPGAWGGSGFQTAQVRVKKKEPQKTGLFSHLPEEKLFHADRDIRNIDGIWQQTSPKHEGDLLQKIFNRNDEKLEGNSLRLKEKKIGEPPKEIAPRVWKPNEGLRVRIQGHKNMLIIGASILIFLAMPILGYFVLEKVFVGNMKSVYASLAGEGTASPRAQDLAKLDNVTKRFEAVMGGLLWLVNPLGLSPEFENQQLAVELAKKSSVAVGSLETYRQTLAKVYEAVVRGDNDPLDFFAIASTQVEQASKDLGEFSAELGTLGNTIPLLPSIKAEDVEKTIGGIRRDLVKQQHLLSVLPTLLGSVQKRTYLVLIQNPLELRASGGFLESFAFITFDRGKLLDAQVYDVAEADNLLKGKVDPPADLRVQLGESQWYFRDSNWNTNFPFAARQAEWFVEKEMGRPVDGTIAINAAVLEGMLRVVGPVVVGPTTTGSQQEQITADNLMERLFTKSESLFQNNQSKKALLSSVTEAVFSKLQDTKDEESRNLGGTLFSALQNSNMMISVRNQQDEAALALVGVTGTILTPPCPPAFSDKTCVVDTVFQVDSNIGVNRANYSIKRYFEHNVALSQTAAVHTYTAHYTNTALSTAWPSGTYKNYIRLVLPDFTQVNSILVNKVALSGSVVAQKTQYGKREVGFTIEVPVGKTVDVQVNYVTIMAQPKTFSYALFTQRQAGTGGDPISFSLTTQKPLRITKLAPDGTVSGNLVQFDTKLDKHQYLAVEVQ